MLKRLFHVGLIFVIIAQIASVPNSVAQGKKISVSLKSGSPGNLQFLNPNKDIATIDLTFTLENIKGYTKLEVNGNQSWNVPFVDVDAFKNGTLRGADQLDVSSSKSGQTISKLIEEFIGQDPLKRLDQSDGKIRWTDLLASTFEVSNVPIVFDSKLVYNNAVKSSAVIQAGSVRFKAIGLDLGEPASWTESEISEYQTFNNATLSLSFTATIQKVAVQEDTLSLYSPSLTFFNLDGLSAEIGGVSDVGTKLDFVRPGEGVSLVARGHYVTGNFAGGTIPENAVAKLSIPTLIFSYSFTIDKLVIDPKEGNANVRVELGHYGSTGQDRFKEQVPNVVSQLDPNSPIRRGYYITGVLTNAIALANDLSEYNDLKGALKKKINDEILPIVRAAYWDIVNLDMNAISNAYRRNVNALTYKNEEALADAIADEITTEIIKTLKSIQTEDNSTQELSGGFGDNYPQYFRVIPEDKLDIFYSEYEKAYAKFHATDDLLEKQKIIRLFDDTVRSLTNKNFLEKVWFGGAGGGNTLKAMGFRVKQDDVVQGRGFEIPGTEQIVDVEGADLDSINSLISEKLKRQEKNILFINVAEYDKGNPILQPERSWIAVNYSQLYQGNGIIKGELTFTNYSDAPITNFPVYMYLFNAETGEKIQSKLLGYVHGTSYEFYGPYNKRVTAPEGSYRSPSENFPGGEPLKDEKGRPIEFFPPGKPVKIPIEFQMNQNGNKKPVVLVVGAGVQYKETSRINNEPYGEYEYFFEPVRTNYFKSQNDPSMFTAFTPNRILTREAEGKFGGGLVAYFSIAPSDGSAHSEGGEELQRQVQLQNKYGNDPENIAKEDPPQALRDTITIFVLKPYQITIGNLQETDELKEGYWVPGQVSTVEWERTIWNVDPKLGR